MKIKKRFPINLRSLILSLAIISMIITLTNAYVAVYNVQKKLITDQILSSNLNYSSKLAATTESFLSSAQQELAYSATSVAESFSDDAALLGKSEQTYRMSQSFNSIFIADTQNKIQAVYPTSLNLKGNTLTSEASKLALVEKKPLISQPYVSMSGNLIVLVSSPIKDKQGNYLGYIGGTIYLKSESVLNEFMNTHFYNDYSSVYVIDKNGVVLYHQDKQWVGKPVSDERIKEVFRDKKSGTAAMPDMQGMPSLAGFDTVNSSGWIIITLHPSQTVIDLLDSVMRSVLYEGAPVMILTLIALTLLAFSIANPLRLLAVSASKMEEPDVIEKIKKVPSWYFEVDQLKRVILFGTLLLHKRIGKLSLQAHTDPLTGLLNRRGIYESIELILSKSNQVAAIVIDIDHFKRVNDTYGHNVGDDVIRLLAKNIKQGARESDLICRTGGEEFLALLPDTDMTQAADIAERLRKKVEKMPLPIPENITISLGVTCFIPGMEQIDSVLKIADDALYQAKHEGRNRVVIKVASDHSVNHDTE
ncbi:MULTISPECIES: sensor domain-containing diguanylate cyclase [Pectobacterium]|uniref:sensor domain-containing diguanylate cyclase n=1 Tax=Pectobacterium TaxID=122277 RepID=UPI0015DE174E|nr:MULTISPECIES: sensor domain-containing diguanylate cyclase [Pectobacterium]MDK9424223.1 sensor domain-containing diguanylate cyclase [Pectobacterium carotovorum]QLL92350.1 GGDEF domain-containing protein [Pectobacterium carotovorum]GKV92373.1 cell signaling regulator [Pectobacterium carotovorum subsp. carotovorum]GKW09580.1 cell signaling regulator [Pectobacterium carotovorum subsp. carotovorum]